MLNQLKSPYDANSTTEYGPILSAIPFQALSCGTICVATSDAIASAIKIAITVYSVNAVKNIGYCPIEATKMGEDLAHC